jgi:hypothetical protein
MSRPIFVLLGLICSFAFGEEYNINDLNNLQTERAASAASDFPAPVIQSVSIAGDTIWSNGQTFPATISVGQIITLEGSGFGGGPDIDFAKILIGNTRVLERDLWMFHGVASLIQRLFYEEPQIFDTWPKDILSWTDTQIQFRVPVTASRGPLVIQIQKRLSVVTSLANPDTAFVTPDPVTERVQNYNVGFDVVSRLGFPQVSNSVPLTIENSNFASERNLGEAIFWNYEFNMGLAHKLDGVDWNAILSGNATDPVTGLAADPKALFGAVPLNANEVPQVASAPFYFNPYPSPMPIKPILRDPLLSGWTTPTGFVGFNLAQSINPITQLQGSWTGMGCASCHTQRITYQDHPGHTVSQVFPGLPNVNWTMKWTVLTGLKTVTGNEVGPDGTNGYVDKSLILYNVPPGTGEHTLVRHQDGSMYGNDYLFSPSAFPIVTRHTPIRRALSHTEMYAGFEGSYIHAEEPDGAVGAMRAQDIQAFTAYMSTLDENDNTLELLGIYRWLNRRGKLDEVNNVDEGTFMETGLSAYPTVQQSISKGKAIFGKYCLSCHQFNGGTWSNEDMMPFSEEGTYFSPTLFQQQTEAIRTTMIRNIFWVEGRGLLHDGHVKSMEDLVDPDRCNESSSLYQQYYTLNPTTFKIPKGDAAQELALRRHAYFVDVPWDSENLYWDYQTERKNFGPREFKSPAPVPLPATPHPWCVQTASEIDDLIHFLLTL